jgi:hypothetical protein
MKISANMHLTQAEINELSRILDCSSSEMQEKLSKYTSAAMREYVDMFLGQKIFKRGSDMLEYRLFLLIEEAFGNMIPNEQKVSHLFQTTAAESRSLIRSVMSKYQYQLKVAIESSLSKIIKDAKQDSKDRPFLVVINSQNLAEELNRVLAEIDGSLPIVVKLRGSVSTYVIQPSSYKRIRERLLQD